MMHYSSSRHIALSSKSHYITCSGFLGNVPDVKKCNTVSNLCTVTLTARGPETKHVVNELPPKKTPGRFLLSTFCFIQFVLTKFALHAPPYPHPPTPNLESHVLRHSLVPLLLKG